MQLISIYFLAEWKLLLCVLHPVCPPASHVLCRAAYSVFDVNNLAIFDSGTTWACFPSVVWASSLKVYSSYFEE